MYVTDCGLPQHFNVASPMQWLQNFSSSAGMVDRNVSIAANFRSRPTTLHLRDKAPFLWTNANLI